jgi:hypothetical protein
MMEAQIAAAFASGRIVDGILLLVACEALALAWIGRRRGPPLPSLLANLASGAALMLALRAALVGAGWVAVACGSGRPRHNAAARRRPEQRRKRSRSRASPD